MPFQNAQKREKKKECVLFEIFVSEIEYSSKDETPICWVLERETQKSNSYLAPLDPTSQSSILGLNFNWSLTSKCEFLRFDDKFSV